MIATKTDSTPIIKPVDGLCNLACSYCYTKGLKRRRGISCMKLKTLRATIDFFCEEQDEIEFIWHGGEPLLAGLEFFQKAIEYQGEWERKGKHIRNFIQTNATLVDPKWTNFFSEHNFFVGVSLDGSEEFHDKTRRYSPYRGSYEDVIRGINLLQKAGVFNGVICGVSTLNHRFPAEIFNFFTANGIKKLKFARVKNIGHCKDMISLAITPAQYADFMITIFNLWLDLDDTDVEIRDIQSVVNLILGGNMRECIYLGQCHRFVTVYSDGSIYGCDSFPKTDTLNFGKTTNVLSVTGGNARLNKFQKLQTRRKKRCKKCEWYFICNGGCANDCYKSLDSVEPIDEVCESLKKYYEHISARIKAHSALLSQE